MSMNNDRSQCIYTERPQKEKITLILSDKLMTQINFLHKNVVNTEWSGILLYKVLSGDIENPESLVLQADYLFPMDIGSSTYTEFDYDDAYIEMHQKIEIIKDGERIYKIGTIHTHHNMGTFFSGTDTGELHTNANKHNFYLSLIVNYGCDYKAKVAMHATGGETTYELKGSKGTILKKERGLDSLFIYDCDVKLETLDWFTERYNELKSKKSVYIKPYTPPPLTDYSKKGKGKSTPKVDSYDPYNHQSHLDFNLPSKSEFYTPSANEYELKKSICASITGNYEEYADIYNCVKRLQSHLNDTPNLTEKQVAIFQAVERVATNFKLYWKKQNGKNRDLGKFELDEKASECLKLFKSYTFINCNDAVRTISDALDKFILEFAE